MNSSSERDAVTCKGLGHRCEGLDREMGFVLGKSHNLGGKWAKIMGVCKPDRTTQPKSLQFQDRQTQTILPTCNFRYDPDRDRVEGL